MASKRLPLTTLEDKGSAKIKNICYCKIGVYGLKLFITLYKTHYANHK